MKCVTLVSYLVIVNGKNRQTFKPARRIRQGDPLIPLLFLICSEGLSSFMRIALREWSIKGDKAIEGVHYIFERGAQVLKSNLKEYEICLGQSVNYDKSTVFYSTNTSEKSRRVVSNILGVRNSNNMERYLGLPNDVGKNKKASFQLLKDGMRQRIENWNVRFLSQEGKGVFIKATLQHNGSILVVKRTRAKRDPLVQLGTTLRS
ncbi:RNA-directed DNA polymerase [Gossypium australe]|uniref:RNA-directed DNA polymerase n=1 Tax=Gossypium australe TaxID=47621 RepID=A0A5B6VUM5_9ROSI|nr:RNA-directed DNA polymerase [Gossypium australe]